MVQKAIRNLANYLGSRWLMKASDLSEYISSSTMNTLQNTLQARVAPVRRVAKQTIDFSDNVRVLSRGVLEEMFIYMRKTGQLIEKILNDCLGLPPDFLKDYSQDRSWDFLLALRYFPATETENNGITEHEDGNSFTFVIQDEVGGLEVKKDGKWIPVVPAPGTIVVNISDVIQVLSNKQFKSATHRVVRSKERSRHSFAFFHNIEGEKWVEPLPQFTAEIGEAPKYRGFLYKDYQAMRLRNKTHPPARPEDAINITHYAVTPTK